MTMKWSFSYNSFVKFNSKNFGSNNMTMLYPIPCYNDVCYKGTAPYYICVDKYQVHFFRYLHSC